MQYILCVGTQDSRVKCPFMVCYYSWPAHLLLLLHKLQKRSCLAAGTQRLYLFGRWWHKHGHGPAGAMRSLRAQQVNGLS